MHQLRTRQNPQAQQLQSATEVVERAVKAADGSVRKSNQALALAHSANGTSIEAHKKSTEAFERARLASVMAEEVVASVGEIRELHDQVREQARAVDITLGHEFNRLQDMFTQELARTEQARRDLMNRHNQLDQEARIELEKTILHEKQRLRIFEEEYKARGQAAVAVEEEKWKNIKEMIRSPELIGKMLFAVTAIAMVGYGVKYGIPLAIDYFKRPHVVSETSKKSWLSSRASQEKINIDDLIFEPELQKQLLDLALRVKTAKEFNESLPNVLFFGISGTGKTAFAKALSYWSGLDYAITSGSEFAKITDLSLAIKELRKLLDWAQNSKKGLIIFIDEAELLFINRLLLPPSSVELRTVQSFINTFLSLVPEKSQKKVMFIFTTNHPFQIDKAIMDRVGINVEFVVPPQAERIAILGSYLEKFAQENTESPVQLPTEIMDKLADYAQELEGFVPRAIKFIAEAMIIRARRDKNNLFLTDDIVQETLREAKINLQQISSWEKEHAEWLKNLMGLSV